MHFAAMLDKKNPIQTGFSRSTSPWPARLSKSDGLSVERVARARKLPARKIRTKIIAVDSGKLSVGFPAFPTQNSCQERWRDIINVTSVVAA
jgi:hypothetical protein